MDKTFEAFPASVGEMVGKTFVSVERVEDAHGGDELVFTAADGVVFRMRHAWECCEDVYIESIVGDLEDLAGEPIVIAEEARSEVGPPGVGRPKSMQESQTWTFYKFATRKGYVDIRWYGTSNGHYSEGVNLMRMVPHG
jgi:hypothetical protein